MVTTIYTYQPEFWICDEGAILSVYSCQFLSGQDNSGPEPLVKRTTTVWDKLPNTLGFILDTDTNRVFIHKGHEGTQRLKKNLVYFVYFADS
jgi:hypothetical protein